MAGERGKATYRRPSVLSARFMRAVKAEHDRLASRLENEEAKAAAGRAPGGSRIAEIKTELAGLRLMLLKAAPEDLRSHDAPGLLRGRAIREAAVAALVRRGFDAGPIHYRAWLALLEEDGRSVAGRRPDAVFLSQVARHPLVRATTRPGFYELDSGAVLHLESRVNDLRASLVALVQEADPPPDRSVAPHEAHLELSRVMRRLEEARAALAAGAETVPG